MPASLPFTPNFVEEPVAEFVEELNDRHAVFTRERSFGGASCAGSRDEPAHVGLIRADDGSKEVDGRGLVTARYDAFREVDVGDWPFEASSGGGDVAVILSGDERADAFCDIVRYVAISEVESHAGLEDVVTERRFSRRKRT
jgi:hypothetical protein